VAHFTALNSHAKLEAIMTGDEIREAFLKFFEEKGHSRVRSSPLLPANDPTLLFTNAGMNQFKDTFLGSEKREYVRAVSSQKCIRAGGKHNDLDEVGKTARHHTFFEMLGNFSFGDYFKREAIQYAWDLLLNVYKLPLNRLWFSVYLDDDDAARLWEEVGAPPDRILRFGEKDNFWQMGDTGPCGPCSEIHYYMGEDPDDPTKNRVDLVNGPGDDTMEIWNLVFMQYERSLNEAGEIVQTPLPKPSVDTGAGLERLAVVLQGVTSNYDTDLVRPIINFTAQLADRNYEPDSSEGFAMRVIADHARAAAFAIADGILPGNEGRNYVLRKIMRRAIYQGHHTLGFEGAFFNQVTNFVVDLMKDAYPELESHRDFIEKMVRLEEERFRSTLTVGLTRLDDLFASTKGEMPEYKALARLYDTFGTPRDLIRVSLEERGFVIHEDEFNRAFDDALQQLQQAGTSDKAEAKAKTNPVYAEIAGRVSRSVFRGYETTAVEEARIVALLKGDEVERLVEGNEGEMVLDQTPFYAESGGQVGDVGEFVASGSSAEMFAKVTDTYSPVQGLIVHKVRVERGEIRAGDNIIARVDVEKRDATRRNHTATHLMHAALREVLGTHVKQAGSVVAPAYLRFDFTHYQPLTQSEIEEIERLVNYHILRNVPVQTDVMAIEEAMQSGAMALFGEKYGEKVRVLSIKGIEDVFSKELCGGTHVRATGDIGLFKITSDESIASGVRRIRAITGFDAYDRFRETEILVDEISSGLRTSRNDLLGVVTRLQDDLKKARRESEELRLKIASGAAASTNGDESREIAGVRVIAREENGLDASGMRQLSDTLLARIKSGVVVLGRNNDGKVSLIVRTSSDLTGKIPAGQVIKELAPIVGGRGGGKADMAEGGGTQPEKLEAALQASFAVVERLVNQASPNPK
jgi:alanyl-tRNA synthetase